MDEIAQNHPDVITTYVKLDLANNASVRQAAHIVNSQIDKLDILINNAGGIVPISWVRTVSLRLILFSHGYQRVHDLCRWHRDAARCQPCRTLLTH